jgi:DNA-binding transcriptional ArsR family regulator
MKPTHTTNYLMTEVFDALAHPSRLEILDLLRDGEACVCHIQAMLNQRQAYISQHLNVLRHAGLVSSRKDGLRVYYQVCDAHLFEVIDRMKTFLQSTGKWQPEEVEDKNPRQLCTCPQCAEKQPHLQIETMHA